SPTDTLSLHDALPISMPKAAQTEDCHAGTEAKDFGLWAGRKSKVIIAERFRKALGVVRDDVCIDGAYEIPGIKQRVLDVPRQVRSEEHTSELQSLAYL